MGFGFLIHRQYNKLSGNVFRWKFATKDYGIVLVTSTKYVKGDKRLRSSKVLKQDVKQFKYKVLESNEWYNGHIRVRVHQSQKILTESNQD